MIAGENLTLIGSMLIYRIVIVWHSYLKIPTNNKVVKENIPVGIISYS